MPGPSMGEVWMLWGYRYPPLCGNVERTVYVKARNNQDVLEDLESQITNSDDVHIEQINEEIKIINQVIEENKAELEQVIAKLSQMESNP